MEQSNVEVINAVIGQSSDPTITFSFLGDIHHNPKDWDKPIVYDLESISWSGWDQKIISVKDYQAIIDFCQSKIEEKNAS